MAKQKDLPIYTLGPIVAGYSLSMLLFSPCFSTMLTELGKKRVLLMGSFCMAISIICFGLCSFIGNPYVFGIFSFLCRCVEGFSNGCLNSSINSIILGKFKNKSSNLIGVIQSFTGLGMLSGPLIGSILYQFGGYQLPFIAVGSLLLMMSFIIAFKLPDF